jgi:sigma-B regulation protein RsbU (phosphoserine phosphatase)
VRAVLDALARAATGATGASAGGLLVAAGERLRVAAAAGDLDPGRVVGAEVGPSDGVAGYVVSSGQPVAVAIRPDAPAATSALAGLLGRSPATILCVPCAAGDEVVGALELIDKAGGGPFTFDDVEVATLLGGIAAVAMAEAGTAAPAVPDPAQLAGDLRRLAGADPTRYAAVAPAVAALLADG